MTATPGGSPPRTARVHSKHGFHTVVIAARVGVVFATWTGVCLSGGGAVRESPPSPALEHDPVPPVSHSLLRAPGWGGGRCVHPCLRPACRPSDALSTRGTAGKRR